MELKKWMQNFPLSGRVEWLSRRLAVRGEIEELECMELKVGCGIVGDHYSGKSGSRDLTIIQAEHLPAGAAMLGKKEIDPALLRRNVVVSGINLLALKDSTFRLGTALLEYTGLCHPCSRMEEVLGYGGYNAMRGHGGITARILESGIVRSGDELKLLQKNLSGNTTS